MRTWNDGCSGHGSSGNLFGTVFRAERAPDALGGPSECWSLLGKVAQEALRTGIRLRTGIQQAKQHQKKPEEGWEKARHGMLA